jgi:hypothetical protein
MKDNLANRLLKDIMESQGFANEPQANIRIVAIPDENFDEIHGRAKAHIVITVPESMAMKLL